MARSIGSQRNISVMGRRTRRRLLALAAGSILAFSCGELWARWKIGTPLPERRPTVAYLPHPTRGYQLIPGDEHYTYDHRVRVNALGLRGPDLGPKKAGELRILMAGDSFVYGHGVGDAETIPALLERELEQHVQDSRTVSVANGGLQAYATQQELALVRELAPEIAPDVVLLAWFWNDITPRDVEAVESSLRQQTAGGKHPRPEPTARQNLEWWALQTARQSALVMWLRDLSKREALPDAEALERALEDLVRQLEAFRGLCARDGHRFGLVVIPEPRGLLDGHPIRAFEARVEESARELGIEVLSVRERLEQLARELGRAPTLAFDGHYEAAANRAIAAGLAEELLRLGWAP